MDRSIAEQVVIRDSEGNFLRDVRVPEVEHDGDGEISESDWDDEMSDDDWEHGTITEDDDWPSGIRSVETDYEISDSDDDDWEIDSYLDAESLAILFRE